MYLHFSFYNSELKFNHKNPYKFFFRKIKKLISNFEEMLKKTRKKLRRRLGS